VSPRKPRLIAVTSTKSTSGIIVTIIVIALLAFYQFNKSNKSSIIKPSNTINNTTTSSTPIATQSSTKNNFKIFQSKALKFTIKLPTHTTTIEKSTYVDFILVDSKINVSKNNTNFDVLDDYIKDFDSIRKSIKVQNEERLNINGLNAVKRIEFFNLGPINQQKVYYIYNDYAVYSISTTFQPLYPDLDQIAQSFRYTP
jgi:hypothetical protein